MRAIGIVLKPILRAEKRHPPFEIPNERAIEYAFVFRQLAREYPASVLDVGTGVTALPHLIANCGFRVTAIDNIRDYWRGGMINRHFLVEDVDVTTMTLSNQFEMVLCISTLEHIEDYQDAVNAMVQSLRAGGLLVMTFPYTHESYVENVYKLEGSDAPPDVSFGAHSFSGLEVGLWEETFGLEKVEDEYWRFYAPGPWSVGNRLSPPERSSLGEPHQIACFAWRKL